MGREFGPDSGGEEVVSAHIDGIVVVAERKVAGGDAKAPRPAAVVTANGARLAARRLAARLARLTLEAARGLDASSRACFEDLARPAVARGIDAGLGADLAAVGVTANRLPGPTGSPAELVVGNGLRHGTAVVVEAAGRQVEAPEGAAIARRATDQAIRRDGPTALPVTAVLGPPPIGAAGAPTKGRLASRVGAGALRLATGTAAAPRPGARAALDRKATVAAPEPPGQPIANGVGTNGNSDGVGVTRPRPAIRPEAGVRVRRSIRGAIGRGIE